MESIRLFLLASLAILFIFSVSACKKKEEAVKQTLQPIQEKLEYPVPVKPANPAAAQVPGAPSGDANLTPEQQAKADEIRKTIEAAIAEARARKEAEGNKPEAAAVGAQNPHMAGNNEKVNEMDEPEDMPDPEADDPEAAGAPQ